MAFNDDEELLQDFLVEAGEILEQLNEQLVELEHRPKDKELLNTVFRGFHTVKGGASFLSLDALVSLCHRAEDVFNALRNDERQVDAQLMDVMLPVLDVLNTQFDQMRSGTEPTPAEPSLLQALEDLLNPDAKPVETKKPAAKAPAKGKKAAEKSPAPAQPAKTDAADADFDAMVEQAGAGAANAKAGDEITEAEFEALLDQLHGSGKPVGISAGTADEKKQPAAAKQQDKKPDQKPAAAAGDEISEDEFEALLDELHGSGKHGGAPKQTVASTPPAAKPKVSAPKEEPETGDSAKAAALAKDASAQAETTVRVDTKRLDDIMNMVGELVLVRNRMATLGLANRDEELAKVVSNLDVVTADLQAAVMKTRMQPIKKVFGRFPRVVRDLARSLRKEVNLELVGEETDLDKNLVEALADPLVHLVRNAVDHGIESPDEREAAGKPKTGTVVLSAEQEGDHIVLTIQDDGKGMDPEKLRKIAVTKGLMDEETAARLDITDCYNLIFAPGFSTKTEISDVSGRGVGMDVVKTRIEQLNGTVNIYSEIGKGSTIRIQVPLTLAIMPTLMVVVQTQVFALPLASVNEIFHLDLTKTNVIDGQLVVMVREKALPLFYLRRWLIAGAANDELPSEGHVVVVSIGAQRVGFVVDQLVGQEEVVIKPLGAMLHGMKGLAGATITGNGRISLILDIPGLMQRYARRR
jgi:two-component system chemotaxis sensor kinase CheA